MSEISMSHPSEGEWRAWLDGEAAEDTRLGEEHLQGCLACRTSVDELRAGSREVSGLLDLVAPDSAPTATERNTRYAEGLAPAAAGIRLVESTERAEESTVEEKEPVMVSNSILKRWRIAAGAVAAALALGVVLATPVGQTAFAQFLAQFRSEQFRDSRAILPAFWKKLPDGGADFVPPQHIAGLLSLVGVLEAAQS